jgi:heme A synthase
MAAFALALVFGIAGTVISKKRRTGLRWMVPAAYGLAAICILGGLAVAYRHAPAARDAGKAEVPAAGAPSMRVDTIDQKVGSGSAVSGVQGNVTINAPAPQVESRPKK